LKIGLKNGGQKVGRVTMGRTRRHSATRSGSGRVAVVPVDRGDQCGSNGSG
jgi:hypothetical protein